MVLHNNKRKDINNNCKGINKGQMIPVTVRSKAWSGGCSLAGIVGSSQAGDMEFRLLSVLCVVR